MICGVMSMMSKLLEEPIVLSCAAADAALTLTVGLPSCHSFLPARVIVATVCLPFTRRNHSHSTQKIGELRICVEYVLLLLCFR